MKVSEDWDLETLHTALKALYPISFTVADLVEKAGGVSGLSQDFILDEVLADVEKAYEAREEALTPAVTRELERKILLSVLDRKWREHLYEMDYLQEGIGLRAMAQRDPLVEYQREGYDLFAAMMDAIKEELVGYLFNVEVSVEEESGGVEAKGLSPAIKPQNELRYSAADEDGAVLATGGTSRNAPCPCGSGRKFKRCHGAA